MTFVIMQMYEMTVVKNLQVQGDEEGGNEVDEESAAACDEEIVVGVNEEPTGAYHEKTAVEEAEDSGIERLVIEIDDDEGDDCDIPLAIPPLHHYVGDPTSTVDVDKCTMQST